MRMRFSCFGVLGLGLVALFAWAQDGHGTRGKGYDGRGGTDTLRILRMKGEVLASGSNEQGQGKSQLLSYRLEKVTLDEPVQLAGFAVYNTYHLFITSAGNISCPCTVFIEDNPYPAINAGDNQAAVQWMTKPSFLEGSRLALADLHGNQTELPERLRVPSDLREGTPKHVVAYRRIATSPRFNGRAGVHIIINSPWRFETKNMGLVLQIGRRVFDAGAADSIAESFISEDDFMGLPEDAPMYLKWGESAPGTYIGRLRKGSLR